MLLSLSLLLLLSAPPSKAPAKAACWHWVRRVIKKKAYICLDAPPGGYVRDNGLVVTLICDPYEAQVRAKAAEHRIAICGDAVS